MPDGKIFDAWITRYALTRGVFSVRARHYSPETITIADGSRSGALVSGHDWWAQPELAVKRAEQMRAAKIASLEKQIAKLKALRFEGAA